MFVNVEKNRMKLNDTIWKIHILACDVVKLINTKTISDVSNLFIKKRIIMILGKKSPNKRKKVRENIYI